ncbi:MAG: NUDIX hydrolase [Chloroflexi bacterium]|nr:NUDIX hydrolase [Chloroflexota bacterium]|tara:strand:- start:916 stop:1548 length:633 start_codon:yes stop_codon:yes gene_type:complete
MINAPLPENMKYCPRCAAYLEWRPEGGRDRPSCTAPDCKFVFFGESSIGCAGVVLRDGKALLVQRGWEPFAGTWQLPGGYVEQDEVITEGVAREVMEEAGVTAKVNRAVAFRHSLGGTAGGPSANVYIVFALDYVAGEPEWDGDEIANAGFYSLEEMSQIEGVQGLSRWAIELTLNSENDEGLLIQGDGPMANRPGWSLFGLRADDPDLI